MALNAKGPSRMADDQVSDDDTDDDTTTDDAANAADTTTDDTTAAKPEEAADKDKVTKGDSDLVKARKHERAYKRERAARDELQKRLDAIEESNKTEQQKAIDVAKAEAKASAIAEYTPAARATALELAVTKAAAVKGITIGEGDDAKTVKFSDPDDVQMWIERRIARGDIDSGDIYTADGKVDPDALGDVLLTLAQGKPAWLVGASNGTRVPAGDADAGKGQGAKDPDAGSVEDHLKHIQKR